MADQDANQGDSADAAAGSAGAGRKCRECGKPVPPGTVKCACGAYQGWHRFVPRSPGTIAAILALPVGAGATAAYLHSYLPANVHAKLAECHWNNILLQTVNRGGTAATLEAPSLWKLTDQGWDPIPTRGLRNSFTDDARQSDPGETDDLPYANDLGGEFFTPEESHGHCWIAVAVGVDRLSNRPSYAGDACACTPYN
ncbi:MAG TPA: hypothetical protein VK614_00060 [Allosphingosinicella sp.]|nr:hypothetical protein [Allosphingosinicella sp.]